MIQFLIIIIISLFNQIKRIKIELLCMPIFIDLFTSNKQLTKLAFFNLHIYYYYDRFLKLIIK